MITGGNIVGTKLCIFSTRLECSFHIFSTRLECSFRIFSTRFECSFRIFSTRFECSFSQSPYIGPCHLRIVVVCHFYHRNTEEKLCYKTDLEKIHSKRVEKMLKLHSKRVEKMFNYTRNEWKRPDLFFLLANGFDCK